MRGPRKLREKRPASRIGEGLLIVAALCGCGHTRSGFDRDLREASPESIQVLLLAGTPGTAGREDGPARSARFSRPGALALDIDGSLLVADPGNHGVRRLSLDGKTSTVANPGGQPGNLDGPFPYARLQHPAGLAVAPDRSLFIADSRSHRIRRLTKLGRMETFAGSGEAGLADGPLLIARFDSPHGLAFTNRGNLIVADHGNHCLRWVSPDRVTRTLAGNGEPGFQDGDGAAARFRGPTDLALDPSNPDCFYVIDEGNHAVRRVDLDGTVVTVAGDGNPGHTDGDRTRARFRAPRGIAVDEEGVVYVADTGNRCIRRIDGNGVVTTLVGAPAAGPRPGSPDADGAAPFLEPTDLQQTSEGILVVSDGALHVLKSVAPRPASPESADGPVR